MEIDSLKSQLQGLRQFEETIKNAAIDARRNADMTVENAKKEAELILSKARDEAEKELSLRASQVNQIEDQITKIGLTKKSYLSKVRSLIQSHLDMVDEVGSDNYDASATEDRIEVESSNEVDARTRETVATQPSEDSGIKTEEANASEHELSDSAKTSLAAAIRDAVKDEPQAEPEAAAEPDPYNTPGIDPELAAALENYKTAKQGEDAPAPQAEPQSPPPVVETTARAEDIPDGFVATNADTAGGADESMEHNTIDPDASEDSPKKDAGPENIANELDQVVAKFEEEMDKAAKS